MSVALVHIGTHKTGTKSFQRWANTNRDALLEQHDIYVVRGMFIESNLALPLLCTRPDRNTPALIANPDARLPECRAAMREHVAAQVANDASVLLSSAEDLSLLRHPDEVEALVEILAPREVRVSVCLRDPEQYLRAYRSQMDRLGQHESSYPSAHTYYGPDTWLTRWDDMLATWRRVLGAESVTSFSYEEAMAEHGSSIPGLLESFDLPVDELPSWRGYRENVTEVEEHRSRHGMSPYARLRAAVAATPPGQALRRALRDG
jgi:hypothetical protein